LQAGLTGFGGNSESGSTEGLVKTQQLHERELQQEN
jgi:hypothetical protein